MGQGFKKGDRVKLVSDYYGEAEANPVYGGEFGKIIGTVSSIEVSGSGAKTTFVRWDNGYSNGYDDEQETLELAEPGAQVIDWSGLDTELKGRISNLEETTKQMASKSYKVTKKVELPVNEEQTGFVPTAEVFEDQKKLLEGIALAISKKMPVLLIGETGTGKTSLVRHLAAMTNNGFRRVNHNGGTTPEDVIGKVLVNKDGTYWVDGVLIDAMRKGHWYLADEINASSAEITFVYHSLLDDDGFVVLTENQGEIVKPHPNFRFFAAMNPAHDYSGTKELNKALMSRFTVFKVDFPEPKTEVKVLHKRTGIDIENAKLMVQFATTIRASHAKGNVAHVVSTRDLLAWASMFQFYKKFTESAESTILNKVNVDDFNTVKDSLGLHFKSIDEGKGTKVDNLDEYEEVKP